jgi:phosphatidate cytidylyltransferase
LLRNVEPAGKYIYLLIFIGAWMTDTGAYFIGVFFGKHKLIPEVSPKKTVEGAFGGVLGCIVGYVIFGVILNIFFDVTVNYIALILLAIVISVISQCGDLIASYVKRERGIKDYGSIFPGHGGMMDRFDSIIAVAPVILGIILLLPADIQIFSLIAK